MKIRIDMTGLRYGRLVGICFSHRNRSGHAQWLFACDCGKEVTADGSSVRGGSTASCGCLHRELSAARLVIHGRRAAKRNDPTYRAWQTMNDACGNPGSPRFRKFGALGICVHSAWREDFTAFVADMGERPAATMLDRHDRSADFRPGNCLWVAVRSRSERAKEARSAEQRASAHRAAAAASPAYAVA